MNGAYKNGIHVVKESKNSTECFFSKVSHIVTASKHRDTKGIFLFFWGHMFTVIFCPLCILLGASSNNYLFTGKSSVTKWLCVVDSMM